MAYDETLAGQVRDALAGESGIAERKMFGGLVFLRFGHMCCGIRNDELIVRVGPEADEQALAAPHARSMDFTGRPMRGFVVVSAPGIGAGADMRAWVSRGVTFAATLPPK